MGRRYRKSRLGAGSLIRDTAYISSRLPWWGALLVGCILLLVFYVIFPAWFESILAGEQSNIFYPFMDAWFGRKIHWVKFLGVACAFVGGFFALRNYFYQHPVGRNERGIVGFLARLFGRSLD